MSDRPKQRPQVTDAAKAAAGRRQERLAAALRANLARRKAQSRGRAETPAEAAPPKPRG